MSTPSRYAIKFTRASKKYLREALQIHFPHNPDKCVRYTVYVVLAPVNTCAYLRSPINPVKGTYEVVSLREFRKICFIHLLER